MADNVTTTWKFLRGKGLTPAQAAGVIGSMQGESGKNLDPTATNPNGGAYGIAQWLGGRKTALLAQKNPHSITTQLNYLWSELQGPESGALKALKAAHDPASASHAWQAAFERGAPFEQKYDLRAQNAQQVLKQLSGTPGGPTGADTGTAGPLFDTKTSRRLVSPAVDNQAARTALVYNFLSPDTGGHGKNLLDFAAQAQQLKDVPAQYATDTTTTAKPGATPGDGGPAIDVPGGRVSPRAKAGDPVVSTKQTEGGSHPTLGLAGYPAHDWFAPSGTHAVAPVSGKVIKLSGHDPAAGPTQGPHGPLGWSTYIKGDDGKTYFLTHMGSRNVKVGQRVKQGQIIGTVADYAKYGTPSHIHQGVSD